MAFLLGVLDCGLWAAIAYFSKLFFIAHLLAVAISSGEWRVESGEGAAAGVTIKFKSAAVFGACLKVK